MPRHMPTFFLSAMFAALSVGGVALAQAPAPAPNQLTPQVLGEMLRSATTFHELVRSMNLNKTLGPDQHVPGPDGQYHHPVERTAATIGAGAGVGAAIGGMTRNQNGVLIGALIGSAGGLIIDQIVKHQEEVRDRNSYDPGLPGRPYYRDEQQDNKSGWHQLKEREHNQ